MRKSKHDENAQREPPRAAYVSDSLPVMPPIPACCPRCKGLVVTQYEETRCLICSWYLQPIPVDYREPFQRRETCTNCINKVETGYSQCSKCRIYQRDYRKRTRGKVGA